MRQDSAQEPTVSRRARGGRRAAAEATAEASPVAPALTTLVSAPTALQSGEAMRMRHLVWVVFGVCAVVLGLVPVVQLRPWLKIALAMAMVVDMAIALWMRRLNDTPARTNERRMTPPWIFLSLSNAVVIVAFGLFSPAPILVVLSISYVTQRYGRRLSLTVYLLGAILHLVPATLIGFGVMRDPGTMSTSRLNPSEFAAGEFLILMLFTMAYSIAVVSRRATLTSMQELQRATHAAAQREALLIEAREELERALRKAGPGRFTDQTFGSFKLGAVIGRGAMGEVYDAERADGLRAAVKLLRIDALAQPSLLERFLREATAIAALRSPHVVRVFETGDETAPLPYIAMERLEGHDLAYHLRARARLPAREIVGLLRQVASGVDTAHRVGIVHRDLKPQNLFLHQPNPEAPGVWKVLDFGVSKLRDENGGASLTDGKIVGTPAYMAPEQVRGGDVDGRTDVYALGVVAFRCLTGELPFRGSEVAELFYQIVHVAAPLPSTRVAELPAAVDVVIARAMRKEREARYRTAGELADALAQALGCGSNDDLATTPYVASIR